MYKVGYDREVHNKHDPCQTFDFFMELVWWNMIYVLAYIVKWKWNNSTKTGSIILRFYNFKCDSNIIPLWCNNYWYIYRNSVIWCIFRHKKLKCTEQKLNILEDFLESDKHCYFVFWALPLYFIGIVSTCIRIWREMESD